jgi:hypothetical protein
VWQRAQNIPAPVVGQIYGYRARAVDDLVPVKVLKKGTKKPARVLIRFEEPVMEGREEWVPPVRLKVAWADVDAFRAEEARWDAVSALSPHPDSAEVNAAEQVCELLVDGAVAGFGYRDSYLVVHDLAALAELAHVHEAFAASHPAGFADDNGTLIVPWPVAVAVVKKVLARNPDPVLSAVSQEEAKANHEAIHGHRFASSGRNRQEFYIPPERSVEYDRESAWGASKRAILRDWAGDATRRWDELVELQKEIKRVGDVAEAAIAALRSRGHAREAERLAADLGMTVEMLRHESPDGTAG